MMDGSPGTQELLSFDDAEEMLDTSIDDLTNVHVSNTEPTNVARSVETPVPQGEVNYQSSIHQSVGVHYGAFPGIYTPLTTCSYSQHNTQPDGNDCYSLSNTTDTRGLQRCTSETQYSQTSQPDVRNLNVPPQQEIMTPPAHTNADTQQSNATASGDQILDNFYIKPRESSGSQPFNYNNLYLPDMDNLSYYEFPSVNSPPGPSQEGKSGSRALNYIGRNAEQEVQQGMLTSPTFPFNSFEPLNNRQWQMNSGAGRDANNDSLNLQDCGSSLHHLSGTNSTPNILISPNSTLNERETCVLNEDEDNIIEHNTKGTMCIPEVSDEGIYSNGNVFPTTSELSTGTSVVTCPESKPPQDLQSRSRKKQRSTRNKAYERQEPYTNKEEEKKRRDAIRAKNCRDRNKEKMEKLEAKVQELTKMYNKEHEEKDNLSKENDNLSKEKDNLSKKIIILQQELEGCKNSYENTLNFLKKNYGIVLPHYQSDKPSPQ